MAEKYYWLRLKRDFFKRHDIRIIESMTNGKDYILFYLKLLCESVDHEGKLRFSEQIPYNEEMLATITNTNVDIVRSAIKVFTELNMMEILDDGTFYMNEVEKLIGSETDWAVKKRIYRENLKSLPKIEDNVRTKKDNVRQEIEKETETDTDTYNEKEREKESAHVRKAYGIYNNVRLTDAEMQSLRDNYPDEYEQMIENLSEYMKCKGKFYSDHYATLMKWKREDEKKAPKKKDELQEFYDMVDEMVRQRQEAGDEV